MGTPNNIPNGLLINAQVPLDPKSTINTLANLADLGTDNVLAFTYYEGLRIYCEEDRNWYIWRETKAGDVNGVLGTDHTYPASYVSYGIDYGGRSFNFYPLLNAKKVTPYGDYQVKKVSTNTNPDIVESGDYVINTVLNDGTLLIYGVYNSGDILDPASYDAGAQIFSKV